MRSCPHCRAPVLENHRDDRAPDHKIRHVLIVIYCLGTSSLAQPSKNFGHLLRPAGRICIADGNLQIEMVFVPILIDITRLLTSQHEANKQHFTFIG